MFGDNYLGYFILGRAGNLGRIGGGGNRLEKSGVIVKELSSLRAHEQR